MAPTAGLEELAKEFSMLLVVNIKLYMRPSKRF
jgi:hypothetical protein